MSIPALTAAAASPPPPVQQAPIPQDPAPPAQRAQRKPLRRREVVGIDLDSTAVRVAHVVRRRGRWQWTSRAAVQHRHPLAAQRELGENDAPASDAVGRAVADSLPRPSDGRRRIANVALPASVAVLRIPTDGSAENFSSALRTDLGPSLAPGSSIQSCSWPVGRSSRQMIYAVSGSASEAVGEAVERAGYTCRRIDSRPHALARALSLDATGESRIIVEWGWNECTLVFAQEASGEPFLQPSLCRSLRGYGLSSAERIACRGAEQSAPRRADDRHLEWLGPLVKAAAAEFIRSFRLAETIPGVDTSGPIVVCGAAAAAADLPDLLSTALERPVRRWRWGGEGRPVEHRYAPDDCLFAVSLALACGEIE